jgi:Lrp/AsnC family leucine-responsive transcriptional regulator
MDDRDLQIVSMLQDDARTSNSKIARALGIAPSAVLERIRKLERRGVLRGYIARVDPAAVGRSLLAFIFVQADERPGGENLGLRLAALPEAQEVHHIAGEDCYLVKVRCASTEALGRFLRDKVGALESVLRTRTVVVLGTVKESAQIALPDLSEGGRP